MSEGYDRRLRWQILDREQVDWSELDAFQDRTLFQTPQWLEFLAETQHGTPIVARLCDDGELVAYFSGLVCRRFGMRILGSPLPGWTTPCLAFNARSDEDRRRALDALPRLAFDLLGCVHVELVDRRISFEDATRAKYSMTRQISFHSDLSRSEDDLFAGMTSACRRCIRKAEKSGVTVEEASADSAFAHEYYMQLRDVFAKQHLVPTYPVERVESLIRHIAPPGNLLLLRARSPEGECIATGIYPGFRQTALFWGNASLRDMQHDRPNEALHWYAMRHWKSRGAEIFDWGGGGEYKAKYGGERVFSPWMRKSRYAALEHLRESARRVVAYRQRLAGSFLR